MYCFSGFLEQNRPPCSRKREIDGGFGILDEKSDQSMFSILQQLSNCMVRQTRRITSSWPHGSDLGTSRISSPTPKQVNGWNRCWNLIASQKTDFGEAQIKVGKHGKQTGQTARAVLCLGPPGKIPILQRIRRSLQLGQCLKHSGNRLPDLNPGSPGQTR